MAWTADDNRKKPCGEERESRLDHPVEATRGVGGRRIREGQRSVANRGIGAHRHPHGQIRGHLQHVGMTGLPDDREAEPGGAHRRRAGEAQQGEPIDGGDHRGRAGRAVESRLDRRRRRGVGMRTRRLGHDLDRHRGRRPRRQRAQIRHHHAARLIHRPHRSGSGDKVDVRREHIGDHHPGARGAGAIRHRDRVGQGRSRRDRIWRAHQAQHQPLVDPGAPAAPNLSQATATVKDPKLKAALDKSTKGQTLTPDEQKMVAGAAMMAAESRLRRAYRMLKESEVQQAQVVLAAQDMVDKMQSMLEDASEMQFKELPALVDSIKNQVGIDQAAQFNTDATAALTGLVQNLQGAKQQLDQALGVVTGATPPPDAGMAAMGGVPGGDMAAADDMADAGMDDLDAAAGIAGDEIAPPPEEPGPVSSAALGRAKR